MESKATADDLTSLAASFPLLVYDHGEQPDNSQTLLSVADGSSHIYRVSELQNCRCLETPRGLVFIADTSSLQCSLWNPQTGEKIPLPALDKPLPEYCRCLLSDTICSPDCLVLINDLTQPELLFCHVRGGSEWISQTYDVGLHVIPGSPEPPTKRYICNMAAVQGKFYFMEAPDEVGVFSFVQDPEPRLEMTSFAAPSPDYSSGAPQDANLHYLLESSQELFLVSLFFPGCKFDRVEEVCTYRMDFSKQQWCEVIELGDRAFLLGPHSFAASCPAGEHGLKMGCVYFAFDLFGNSDNFQVFDLVEDTRELIRPGQDIPLLAREPFWMVPACP
ncbi:unnamed protein product [Urochloa decumbens]|uniref:KIB1-4 beta-propeller domain-containing protein n=1 Tax=Urochloa decumbens TaxID=240449 RepID=A0ABC9AEE8_9POAL